MEAIDKTVMLEGEKFNKFEFSFTFQSFWNPRFKLTNLWDAFWLIDFVSSNLNRVFDIGFGKKT